MAPFLRQTLPFLLASTACLAAWSNANAQRVIKADVVAIDQVHVYNRFGSFNPVGMMYALRDDVVVADPVSALNGQAIGSGGEPCKAQLRPTKRPRPLTLRGNVGDILEVRFSNLLCGGAPEGAGGGHGGDRPSTRIATFSAMGMADPSGDNTDPITSGISGIEPGQTRTYRFLLEREGSYLVFDNGTPAGGEGDGGSVVLGLFGAINVEPAGSKWYRSQVSATELSMTRRHDGTFDFEAVGPNGLPVLNMLQGDRIVHADLNAVIVLAGPDPSDGLEVTAEGPYREFTAIFHDELKTVQAFEEMEDESMSAARDSFGINYGSQAVGGALLSNRKGVGPAKDCVECGLEEFFLSAWTSGDPALLVQYADDPSNVHHSYLNDRVKFRSLHAGPKETHVFHLHAHQWLAQSRNGGASTITDSQSLGPRQAYTYDVTFGGGGNRNKTPGDSIFHCHLYPHFTGGMWALWRVHDVFEDGTRALPDGEHGAGTNPLSGLTAGGTPIPAVVPIPGLAMAPAPRYGDTNGDGVVDGNPGYPFFIAGRAGHRAPQAPLDLLADAGLPRHVVVGGTRTLLGDVSSGDLRTRLNTVQLQLLEQDGTPVEKAAMQFHAQPGIASVTPSGSSAMFALNGRAGVGGAPFADPCPASAPLRTYNVSAIQVELTVNRAGWHDPSARINVLDEDAARMERTRTPADPFFFRANSGDCVIFKHTNRTDAELKKDDFQMASATDTVGQHIHLVKFDVTSSDGSSNGWNYEDGTFARAAVEERIAASRNAGGLALSPSGSPVTLNANGGFQTTVQRWWADPIANAAGADRTLRTAFTHDHLAASTIQQHGFYSGLLVEPAGSKWLQPDGSTLPGQRAGVGTEKMIVGATDPVSHPDTREFALAIADFGLVYRSDGSPVNPPPKPEIASAADPGTFLVNYKNEPIPLRLSPNGALPLHTNARGDMANVFRSTTHQDPYTPVFRAYEGDRVAFRLIQGAHEEQHVFTAHGLRWKREISDQNSQWVSAQEIGISEHFEMEIARLSAVAGVNNTADYLYHFGSIDDLWNGAWGLLRTFANVTVTDPNTNRPVSRELAPLPSNRSGRGTAAPGNVGNGTCPTNAPVRNFVLQAHAAKDLLPEQSIVYNRRVNITDPSGLLLIHAADEAALRSGAKKAEPLVLRANAGDCITVKLTNRLPAVVPDHAGDAALPPITALKVDDLKPSNRVSIHPALVHYDVRTSDGATIGFNPDQSAAPGNTVNYTWYAGVINVVNNTKVAVPTEYGVVPLRPFGDVIKQGSQGLVGALVVEPQGATYHDAATGAVVANPGTGALIRYSQAGQQREFLEHVLIYQDGINLLQNGNPIPAAPIADDPEDAGMRAVNYRTEPFWARLGVGAHSDLNGSKFPSNFMLGDLETPLITAAAGQPVRLRVVLPDGRARMHGFSVFGHDYPDNGIPDFLASGASLVAVGKGITANLYGGAKRGTWIWRDGPSHHTAGGIWGRFEVR